MTEAEETRILAHHILNRPSGDPDDELAMLSRQLLRADEKLEARRIALRLLLDAIDYARGACRVNEMIGALVPDELLRRAREAAAQ